MNCTRCSPVAYIDTVALFLRYMPKGTRKMLEDVHDGSVRIEQCLSRDDAVVGYRLFAHQPGRCLLRQLRNIQRLHLGKLSRFDVAFDMPQPREWFERHCVMKWRWAGHMHDEENGLYFVDYRSRNTRPARDFVLYDDKPSKITGAPCTHLEMRFLTAASVRRAGFENIDDLIKLNPYQLSSKYLKIVEFDPQAFTNKMIRAAVKTDRHEYQGKKASSYVDQYRATIHRRIRGLLGRTLRGRAQNLRDLYPKHFEDLKELSVDILDLPTSLSWALIDHKNFVKRG